MKIRRSLFIGIGGTGIKSILHAKKRFIDAYGEIPPMVEFLGLDVDSQAINYKLSSQHPNQEVELEESEFFFMDYRNLDKKIKENPEFFDFIPDQNRYTYSSWKILMPNQLRTTGKVAFHINYTKIENIIYSKLSKILNVDSADNDKFQAPGNDIDIILMFSIAGGTGSGSFIDTAYLVREICRNNAMSHSIIGYSLLPDIFKQMQSGPAMANVLPNSYGALYELDYLMTPRVKDSGLEIKYQEKTIEIDLSPFDLFFTINNKDINGRYITKLNEICELIAGAAISYACITNYMRWSIESWMTVLSSGLMRVEDKESWAWGLGYSELIFNGLILGDIYAYKASIAIVNRLISAGSRLENLDVLFINVSKIRNNNWDENIGLCNAMLPSGPKKKYLSIQNKKNPEVEIQTYFQNIEEVANKAVKLNYEEFKSSVKLYFESFIIEQINKDHGVGNVNSFLLGLKKYMIQFLEEVQIELREIQNHDEYYKNQLDLDIIALKGLSFVEKIFGKKYLESKENIKESVNKVASNYHESIRRQYSIKFYEDFTQTIDQCQVKINDIIRKFNLVKDLNESKIIELQSEASLEPKSNVKELHRDYLFGVVVNDSDIDISKFLRDSNKANNFFDYSDLSEIVIEKEFSNFSSKLPNVIAYRNTSIDEVLANYSDVELTKIIGELETMSSPLWTYDYQGYVENKQHHEAFIIGVPQESQSVIKTKKTLNNILESNQNYGFYSTNMRDRIVIYRMEAALPIYAVSNMTLYQDRNSKSKISHYIDKNWLKKMKEDEFDIYPKLR